MTLMRFDPFRGFDRLSERMLGGHALRTMPIEAYRRGYSFYVLIDIPGVRPDDLRVTVERNVVGVRASRQSPRQEGDELLIDERPHGEFSRQFLLGENLDAGNLAANLEAGVLMLTIPVAEKSKPRRVQVGSSSSEPVEVATGTSKAEAEAAKNSNEPATA